MRRFEQWRTRLGTDIWRNLIAMECGEIERLGLDVFNRVQVISNCDERTFSSPAFRCDVSPEGGTASVRLAGRLFLFGSFESGWARERVELNGGKRVYLIPSSWDESVSCFLSESIARGRLCTLVAPFWFYEELVPALGVSGFSFNLDDPLAFAERKTVHPRELVGFDETIQLPFDRGTRVSVGFAFGGRPVLKAAFLCNGRRIDIFGMGSVGDPVAAQVRIGERMQGKLSLYPEIQNVFGRRYGAVETPFTETPLTLIESELPIDVRSEGALESFTCTLSAAPCFDRMEHPPQLDDDTIIGTTLFLIQCGDALEGREVVDPCRRLEVRVPKTTRAVVTSILCWRLMMFNILGQLHNRTVFVGLLVSADTEQQIMRELASFMPDQGTHLKVIVFRQQLVPRTADASGRFGPRDDGGWRLVPRGHLEIVEHLARFAREYPEVDRCMAFAHNNLGAILTEIEDDGRLNLCTRSALLDVSRRYCSVEVFSPPENLSANAHVWRLSYLADQPAGRLFKRFYRGADVSATPKWFSSHTWYFNLKEINRIRASVPDCYIDRDGRPRQDLEQLTHTDLPVWFVYHDRAIDAHSRSLFARTEDDIRSEPFVRAFTAVHGAATDYAAAMVDPFWEIGPAEIRTRWGGHRLRKKKGLPDAEIGETWEVSTHGMGPSMVYRTLDDAVPLAELLRREDPESSQFPFMAKYLDCEGPLSIQVHPGSDAVSALSRLRDSGKSVKLSDTFAKEESFYVVEPAPYTAAGAHVLFGVDRDKLDPWFDIDVHATPERILEGLADGCRKESRRLLADVGDSGDGFKATIEGRKIVRRALDYHLGRPLDASALRKVLSLIGLIWMFREFALDGRPRQRLFSEEALSLARYFRPVRVERDAWLRVRPGMIHAWQGGGSILIELSHRSNNTFRIFDYGNEFHTETRRQMHYMESMFAVEPWSVVDETDPSPVVGNIDGEVLRRHEGIAVLTVTGNNNWICLPRRAERTFLMNPDGGMRIRTLDSHPREKGIGPCRTVLVSSGTETMVFPEHRGDRVLHFIPGQ